MRPLLVLVALCACHPQLRPDEAPVVVLISASMEWKAVSQHFAPAHPRVERSVWGEWFVTPVRGQEVVFLHGGYGKVAAAGSTQWAIERFHPGLLVNLGTCGGFEGFAARDDLIVVDQTIIYDLVELMGDSAETIRDYSTTLPSLWPEALKDRVRVEKMLSADRDLDPQALGSLRERFHGVAGDWESGAIAYVAAKNHTPILIVRAVSDVVSARGDALYGDATGFEAAAARQMERLLALFDEALPLLKLPR